MIVLIVWEGPVLLVSRGLVAHQILFVEPELIELVVDLLSLFLIFEVDPFFLLHFPWVSLELAYGSSVRNLVVVPAAHSL